MRKRFENKPWALAFAFFALISLVLLAGALRNMDFNPAQPIGSESSEEQQAELPNIGQLLTNAANVPLSRQLMFWGGILLIVLLLSTLLDPKLRKQFILSFLRIASFAIILSYIFKKNPNILAGLLFQIPTLENLQQTADGQEIPPPVFEPPQVSPFLSFLIAFGFILLVVGLFWFLSRWWAKQKELLAAREPLTEIAAIARESLKDLETGTNSNNAIIQCYERMSNVVSKKQGLSRQYAMTPSEFASRLERAGLPREPVARLTRLFESVRYGGYASGPREIDEAVASLTSILSYCGEAF